MLNRISRKLRVACLMLAATAVACSDDGESDAENQGFPTIKIGALADQTGPSASPSYEYAIKLAEKHINLALEEESIPIRFQSIIADSKSSTQTAVDATVKLVNEDQVKAVVADVSANTIAVNQLNYDSATQLNYKIPITCYACSSTFVNNPNATHEGEPLREAAERDEENWLYRVFYNGKYEALVSARIFLNKPHGGDINEDGNFKISIYAGDDNFGQSSAQSLKAALDELLGDTDRPYSVETIFIPFDTDANTYDWGADLLRLVDDHNETTDEDDGVPDGIFLALLPQRASGIVSKRHELGYTDIPMQSVTAFRRNYLLRSIGEKAVGLEGGSPRVHALSDAGEYFANGYIAASNEVPEMLTSHVYDGAMTLMLASLKAAVDLADPSSVEAEAVRDQLLNLTDPDGEGVSATKEGLERAVALIRNHEPLNYSGPSGVFPWDSVGDTFPELVHWTAVNDGSLRFSEGDAYLCSAEHPTCELLE